MRLVEACLFNAENLLVVPVVSTVVNTVRFVEFRNGGARTSKVQKDVLSQGRGSFKRYRFNGSET